MTDPTPTVGLEKEVQRNHHRAFNEQECKVCGLPWPCDAIKLAEEVESNRKVIKGHLDAHIVMGKEITRLQEQERTSSSAILKQIEVNEGLREQIEDLKSESLAEREALCD